MRSTAADVVHLATAELRLAKLEVTEGIRAQAGRVALLVVGALPLLVAYLLGVAALVVWVRPLLGLAGTLALVGASQAAVGAVIIAVASPRAGAKSWTEPGASSTDGTGGSRA